MIPKLSLKLTKKMYVDIHKRKLWTMNQQKDRGLVVIFSPFKYNKNK